MNFGHWIVVSFIVFAAFIATLVVVCMRQDVSLVSKNYYQEELAYQNQIVRKQNTLSMSRKPRITVTDRVLELDFDPSSSPSEGVVNVFCPSDAKMDRLFKLKTSSAKQYFDLAKLNPGMYRVKLQWSAGDQQFYHEEIVFL